MENSKTKVSESTNAKVSENLIKKLAEKVRMINEIDSSGQKMFQHKKTKELKSIEEAGDIKLDEYQLIKITRKEQMKQIAELLFGKEKIRHSDIKDLTYLLNVVVMR